MPAVVISTASSASTVRDVVAQLPLFCQGYYLPAFNQLNDKAQRYFAAKHAEEEFRSMISSGRLPNSINSVKKPTLQVSSEFEQSNKNSAYKAIEQYTSEVRGKFLEKFADAKKAEADFYYTKYLSISAQTSLITDANKKMTDGLLTTFNVTELAKLPEHVSTELMNITSDGGFQFAQHIIEIARLRSLSAYEKTKSKKKIKAAAEVEMSGTAGAVNEKTLEKSVESVLKRKEQSRRDKQKSGKGKDSKKKRKGAPGVSISNAKSSKKPRKS